MQSPITTLWPFDRLEKAAQALVAEGFVCESLGVYRIT